MTFKEICDWVKSQQDLASQVVIALQEDTEPDTVLDGVGPVCFLPFVAEHHEERTVGKHHLSETYRIYIELWENEKKQKAEEFYSWGDLVKWIENMPDTSITAQAMCAWHLCGLKVVNDKILYAYEV
jgi:hypothetical protein